MRRFIAIICALFFITTLTMAQTTQKKTVVLENGTSVTGTVTKENSDYLYLNTGDDELKINKRNILEIKTVRSGNKPSYRSNQKAERSRRSAQDSKTNYVTIGSGYGTSFGGIGLQLQLGFGQIGIHGGLGYFPSSMINTGYEDYNLDDSYLGNIGFKVYLDEERKFFIDLQYGSFGVQGYRTSYLKSGKALQAEADQTTLSGPSLIGGIDVFFSDHFGLNADLGLSYNTKEIQYLEDLQKYWFAFDLGLLVKF